METHSLDRERGKRVIPQEIRTSFLLKAQKELYSVRVADRSDKSVVVSRRTNVE
jgi:hypothetical protein